MARSTGIVLLASGIVFANEWLETDQLNWRVPIAGLGTALVFGGIESLNERAGVGLAWIMLITVLVTPMQGATPLQTLAGTVSGTPRVKVGTK